MRLFLFIILSFLFTGCIQEVGIDTDDVPRQLVVNCFFTEGQPFEVHVSRLVHYTDSLSPFIEDAIVQLSSNDSLLGILPYIGDGLYTDVNILPEQGVPYTIIVSCNGFPTATATDSIPRNVVIESVDYKENAGMFEELSTDEFIASFHDPVGSNFYTVMLYSYSNYYNKWFPQTLYSSDPAIVAEGITNDDFPEMLVCNDLLFDGDDYRIHLNIVHYDAMDSFLVILENVSYAVYQYNKRLIKQKTYSYQSPFDTYSPVPLYSNIENGLGIFAGYQQSRIYLNK